MRFFLTAVLAQVALVSAKLAINSTSYAAGVLTIVEFAFSDAPATYDVALVGSGNKTVIESGLIPMNGTVTISLPTTTPPGSYHVSLVGAGSNSTETYVSSPTFTVAASDFNSTATGTGSTTGTTTATSTTSATPSLVPTFSVELITTDTVFTSGSITTTIAETESTTVSYTLTVQPTPATATAGTVAGTASGGAAGPAAATATITSKTTGSGAMKLKVPGTIAGVMLGGALMAAALVF